MRIKKMRDKIMQQVYANKPGMEAYVVVIILILISVAVGGVFMTQSNTAMSTLFQDMLKRITSSFK